MPVSARFQADFESFYAAVQKADVKLADFARGAARVGPVLDRMTDSFSGRKLIQEAALMERAIEKAGGMATLTGQQLQMAGNKAAEAAEKMKKLGMDVPPGLQKIADAIKPIPEHMTLAQKATGLFTSTFGQMLSAFSVASLISRAASTLMSWTSAAIKGAGAIVDLSAKTGLSMDTIQRFEFVAKQTSSSMEAFTGAAFKLGVNLSGGGTSVRAAVDRLGLSFSDIQKLNPDQQFDKIARALEGMEDPQARNEAAVRLFGKTASEILPAIAQGYGRLADAAKVSSDAQLLAIDAAADRWDKFVSDQYTNIRSLAGDMLLLQMQRRSLTLEETKAMLQFERDGGSAREFKIRLYEADLAAVDAAKKHAAAVVGQTAVIIPFTQELANARTEMAQIDAATRTQIVAAQKLGKTTDEITDRFGISAVAQRLLAEAMRSGATAAKGEDTALREAAEGIRKAAEAYKQLMDHLHAIEQGGPKATFGIRSLDDAVKDLGQAELPRLNPKLVELNRQLLLIEAHTVPATLKVRSLEEALKDLAVVPAPDPKRLVDPLADAFEKLPDLMIAAFTGGGGASGAMKALGVQMAKDFLDAYGGKMKDGAASGAMWVEWATIGYSVYMNAHKAAQQRMDERTATIKDHRVQLERVNAAYVAMGHSVDQAAFQSQKLWIESTRGAKNSEEAWKLFNVAVEKTITLQGIMASGLDQLASDEEKYHLSLNKTSADLYKSYQTLVAGGHSADAVIMAMKDDWIALVVESRKFGIALPAALRPILGMLATAGDLTDDEREKLGDISDLTFDETGSSGEKAFKKMSDGVDILVAAILYSLGFALDETQRKLLGLPPIIEGIAKTIYDLPQGVQDMINRLPHIPGHTVIPPPPPPLVPARVSSNILAFRPKSASGGAAPSGDLTVNVKLPNNRVLTQAVIKDFYGAAQSLGVS